MCKEITKSIGKRKDQKVMQQNNKNIDRNCENNNNHNNNNMYKQ